MAVANVSQTSTAPAEENPATAAAPVTEAAQPAQNTYSAAVANFAAFNEQFNTTEESTAAETTPEGQAAATQPSPTAQLMAEFEAL